MSIRFRVTFLAAILVGIATTGCAVSSDVGTISFEPAPGATPSTPDSSDTVYRAVVQIASDGSVTQNIQIITVAEQRAEQAARASYIAAMQSGNVEHNGSLRTLKIDSGCASADLWLFDQVNLTGNELCLFRVEPDFDEINLGTVCRTPVRNCPTWANAVRSLWAGSDSGSLIFCTPTSCPITPFPFNFTPFQKITNGGSGNNWAELIAP